MMAGTASAKRTRVLVTGAGGFIGRRLVCRLAELPGFEIRAAVRSADAGPDAPIEWHGVGEIDGATDWGEALEGVDVVVHLAGRAHVLRDAASDSLAEFRRVNVAGTLNLARQAAAVVRRFVFVSSIGVNGNRSGAAPFSERDAPHPEEPYAVSKLEAEQALRALAGSASMETVIVRPPLVYGSGAPGNFARLSALVLRAPALPFGAVRNRRSLIAVDNLVDFLIVCMEHPSAASETFLVSDGEDLSTADLVRRLSHAMGRRSRLISIPPGVLVAAARFAGRQEMAQRLLGSLQIDMSKARQRLGWTPPISVDEGLRRAVGDRR